VQRVGRRSESKIGCRRTGKKFVGGLRRLAAWATLAAVLHLLWEIAQLPLYALGGDPDGAHVARYVLHCLAGDVLVAVTIYVLTAIAFREWCWPERRPWGAGVFAVTLGVAFTAASEWYNVYVLGSWIYAPRMPTVGGVGVAPLLQWIIVPTLMIVLWRRSFFRVRR
jgi:hypothetical protein